MIVFRLCRNRYSTDLSGKGAEMSGGRWNSKGTRMIYTSESRALCLAETAVNLPLDFLPDDYRLISIFIPDDMEIAVLNTEELPADWQSFPHPRSTQEIGDLFVKGMKNAVLKVPSAVVPGEFNFLINPSHSMMAEISIEKIVSFSIDKRLKPKAGN